MRVYGEEDGFQERHSNFDYQFSSSDWRREKKDKKLGRRLEIHFNFALEAIKVLYVFEEQKGPLCLSLMYLVYSTLRIKSFESTRGKS